MSIVFFCQSCGARFDVAPTMAGKSGRCRKCGQAMTIPRAEQLASMTAMPALRADAGAGASVAAPPKAAKVAAVAARARRAASSATQGPGVGDWIRQAASSIGLAPISVEGAPAIGVRRGSAPSPLDDAEDSKPYLLAGPSPSEARKGKAADAAGAVVQVWRREVGLVQRIFRWFNESAYLLSVPFVVIFLVGTALKSRPTALFAATFVVLLNLGRLVAGVGNLVLVPLREGAGTGRKLKKPLRRVIEPVLTIAAVFLGFTFIPWLSSESASSGNLVERLREEATSLKSEMKGELGKTVDQARSLDVGKVGASVREGLQSAGSSDAAPTAAPPEGPSPKNAVREAIQDVGRRVRETTDESKKQP